MRKNAFVAGTPPLTIRGREKSGKGKKREKKGKWKRGRGKVREERRGGVGATWGRLLPVAEGNGRRWH